MAEIELFSFKNGDTKLHRAHPTLKILLLIILGFSITYGSTPLIIYYLVVITITLIYTRLTSVVKELKYLLYLVVTITIFQIVIRGNYGSQEIISTLIYIVKIGEIILLGNIFTGTTKPEDITPGIYKIIPNKKLAENISLTIRLIPTFLITWGSIYETLKSRGLYLRKNPFYIIKYVTIPLIIETFRKTDNIATSMESRAYSGWVKEKSTVVSVDPILILITLLPHLLQIRRL